jgi:hypothetical protein
MPASDSILIVDGSLDFSGGVDSLKVTSVASQQNPNGLARNQLAWLVNATVRDGGITQRTGWQPLGTNMTPGTLQSILTLAGTYIYQGAYLYQPDNDDPYFIAGIGGHILQIDPNNPSNAIDLSAQFNLYHPGSEPYFYFAQGENYLVIQAGDYGKPGGNTLPLFWDGTTLRRSLGITNTAVAPGTPGVNEIPAATAMVYYQNRMWYAQFRQYSAGDIVGGNSGTLANHFRDAILNVTENPLVTGGDGFTVPTNAGNIRALAYSTTLDATLGQSNLYPCTAKQIYALQVPVTRADWIAANSTNQPVQTVIQNGNGPVNDRSIVSWNGDLFFQSLEPGVRSLISALRYFGQWQNPAVSNAEERILQFNDRSLMSNATGALFDNRLLQAVLPMQTVSGVVHQAILPLDFLPMSEFGTGASPIWEGHYEGLNIFQMLAGDFGGRERAFAFVLGATGSIDLWELTDSDRFEDGDKRISWRIEFPAYNAGMEFDLKELMAAEIWCDKVFGEVVFTLTYKVDSDPCERPWHTWKACVARNSAETVRNPVAYPLEPGRESYRATMMMPKPPAVCVTATGRPSNIGFQFQPILEIKGWCRIRGILLHMMKRDRKLYQGLVC